MRWRRLSAVTPGAHCVPWRATMSNLDKKSFALHDTLCTTRRIRHNRHFFLPLDRAVVIGFTKYFEFGWLARPFVPATRTVAYAGLALVFAGISFAVWARFYLGGNWSGVVTVKKDHNLVRQGPYAIVRHPIYSGLLLAILGSVVVYRELRGVIAVVLFLVMLRLKSLTEERFMTEKFGLEYRQYQQQVKALIPFIW